MLTRPLLSTPNLPVPSHPQYDIQDPHNPKLVGQIFLGGIVRQGSPFKLVSGLPSVPEVPRVRGTTLTGGPQMIQLSRDGQRLYVTNSLFTVWDKQVSPRAGREPRV